jgi:hypothetical protein
MTKQVKARDKKGITLFSDLGTFIPNNRIADLISYDYQCFWDSILLLGRFCFYHKMILMFYKKNEGKEYAVII